MRRWKPLILGFGLIEAATFGIFHPGLVFSQYELVEKYWDCIKQGNLALVRSPLRRQDLAEAKQHYANAIAIKEKNPDIFLEARYLLPLNHGLKGSGDLQRARRLALEIMRADTNNIEPHIISFQTFIEELGAKARRDSAIIHLQKAEALLERLKTIETEEWERRLLEVGNGYKATGLFERARSLLSRFPPDKPQFISAAVSVAECYFADPALPDNFNRAREYFELAAKRVRNTDKASLKLVDPGSFVVLGYWLVLDGQHDRAIEMADLAIVLSRHLAAYAAPYVLKAMAHMFAAPTGESQKVAMHHLDTSYVKLNNTMPERRDMGLWIAVSDLYNRLGLTEAGKNISNDVSARDADIVNPLIRALVYTNLNPDRLNESRMKTALREAWRFIRESPDFVGKEDFQLALASGFVRLDKLSDERLAIIQNTDSLYALTKMHLGAAFKDMGQIKKAEKMFLAALAQIDDPPPRYASDLIKKNLQDLKPAVYIDLGALGKIQRRWDEAAAYFEQAKQLSEKRRLRHFLPVVYTNLGDIKKQQGELVAARNYFALALQAAVTPAFQASLPYILESLAYLNEDLNAPAEAAENLRQAIAAARAENRPVDPNLYLRWGYNLIQQRKWQEGQAIYLEVLNAFREQKFFDIRKEAYRKLIYIHLELKELEKAEAYLHEAMQAGDSSQVVINHYVQVGAMFSERQDWRQAESHYQKALQLGERFNYAQYGAEVNFLLGRMHKVRNDLAAAQTYFKKALAAISAPAPAELAASIYTELADIAMQQNTYDEAERCYRQMIENSELQRAKAVSPDIYIRLGDLRLLNKDYKQAEKYFRQAVERSTSDQPFSSLGFARLSDIYLLQGQLAQSESCLLKASAAKNPPAGIETRLQNFQSGDGFKVFLPMAVSSKISYEQEAIPTEIYLIDVLRQGMVSPDELKSSLRLAQRRNAELRAIMRWGQLPVIDASIQHANLESAFNETLYQFTNAAVTQAEIALKSGVRIGETDFNWRLALRRKWLRSGEQPILFPLNSNGLNLGLSLHSRGAYLLEATAFSDRGKSLHLESRPASQGVGIRFVQFRPSWGLATTQFFSYEKGDFAPTAANMGRLVAIFEASKNIGQRFWVIPEIRYTRSRLREKPRLNDNLEAKTRDIKIAFLYKQPAFSLSASGKYSTGFDMNDFDSYALDFGLAYSFLMRMPSRIGKNTYSLNNRVRLYSGYRLAQYFRQNKTLHGLYLGVDLFL